MILPPAPSPVAPGGAPPVPPTDCACTDLVTVWAAGVGSPTFSMAVDNLPAIFCADGHICPDSTWSFDLEWDGAEEDIPTVAQVGATTWAVDGTVTGELTITPHATCGGAAFDLDPLTLSIGDWVDITDETYWSAAGSAEWITDHWKNPNYLTPTSTLVDMVTGGQVMRITFVALTDWTALCVDGSAVIAYGFTSAGAIGPGTSGLSFLSADPVTAGDVFVVTINVDPGFTLDENYGLGAIVTDSGNCLFGDFLSIAKIELK